MTTMYAMNTKTKVPAEMPEANEFGHLAQEFTFYFLVDADTGNAAKVYGCWGIGEDPGAEVGKRYNMVQDTGLGHRSMKDHRVVAVRANGVTYGTPPKGKTLPYWVAK